MSLQEANDIDKELTTSAKHESSTGYPGKNEKYFTSTISNVMVENTIIGTADISDDNVQNKEISSDVSTDQPNPTSSSSTHISPSSGTF